MDWEAIFRVVEGRMLVREQVHRLWKQRNEIEAYVDAMLVASSSVGKIAAPTITPDERHFMDAAAVRALEIMDEALESLPSEQRQQWLWRYEDNLSLVELGQMLSSPPRKCRDSVRYWRVKAKRTLDHIAFELARKMRR